MRTPGCSMLGVAVLALLNGACAATGGMTTTRPADAVVAPGIDAIDARPVASLTPMHATVEQRLMPQVDRLLQQLMTEQSAMRIDGQPVFNGRDKFLPGKIAVGMAYVIQRLPRDDPRLPVYIDGFKRIADLTVEDENKEWGIFYYLTALEMLHRSGQLDAAVSPETLAKLKKKLDWRSFVRERDLTLIDLPNNYYGVAFGVAQLRHALGWENDASAQALLAKTLAHYRTYSSTGFADETEGDGRYDRYSVLLIGEIAHRFIEAKREPPPEVREWLRKSAQLMLLRIGPDGDGFEYGRSIGAYGETALVEVLTAAAVLGVLTPAETDAAYAFCSKAAMRYMDFWVDDNTGSVNLWDRGRRTDAYRGKHRILGENLSLARQFFYTDDLWNGLGYRNVVPKTDLRAWRDALPRTTLTRFNAGEPQRALVTVIDGDRLFGLPFINGGAGQHMHSPYFPIPFSPNLVSGIADSSIPQLTPRFVLKDGSVLQPLAYYTHIDAANEGDAYIVTAALSAMDRMGDEKPVADRRIVGTTRYAFSPGRIDREDRYVPVPGLAPARLEIEFANYGTVTRLGRDGADWVAEFDDAVLRRFRVSGFEQCQTLAALPAEYMTPTGAFGSVVRCFTSAQALDRPLQIGWRIEYVARK
jgi:hypothetical protein